MLTIKISSFLARELKESLARKTTLFKQFYLVRLLKQLPISGKCQFLLPHGYVPAHGTHIPSATNKHMVLKDPKSRSSSIAPKGPKAKAVSSQRSKSPNNIVKTRIVNTLEGQNNRGTT